ncbi:DHH family phosphoesterase [Texcoconibacillus texcoconensis]|uniref:Cyclic-di-AMP phosphodiesterase n=1 Tax=Texcoconibacillus texcoconensis TaxID=1095777 RepID=A0A840QU01_9BACI|nr:DHH family phosphoesterase [Texcoconibacillus texcoconensis]MBB5174761.1 c-di-AMP phosphodiesterase-like protein [Texcoconibacillus texcoconensis]
MPKTILRRWHGYHLIALFSWSIVLSLILLFYQWQLGSFSLVVGVAILVLMLRAKNSFENEMTDYISRLTYRINKVGEEAVTSLPIGIVTYSETGVIQWVNPYMNEVLDHTLIGETVDVISESLPKRLRAEQDEFVITVNERAYRVVVKRNERLLYLFDVTDEQELKHRFEQEKTVLGTVYLDNYEEVTQGMDDQLRSKLMSHVTSSLNQWSQTYDIFLRRASADRFIAVLNEGTLEQLEEERFTILDEVREVTGQENVSLTLSIGIGSGERSLRELGSLAQSSLDLALGRGGDQVAIKERNGQVRFYGGKSNAVEKRTRVRARVISHAMRDFVAESDKVLIMGHKNPDMDAIGSSIGMAKIAEVNGKEGLVVVNPNDTESVSNLLEEVREHDRLWSQFISPEEAHEELTEDTLLVVVDTHKPSMTIDPEILKKVNRVIVIDHHRRGEEFIENAVLVYMEPYASSTAELVTELLEYQPHTPSLDVLESTSLLAGIIVDTKSFAIRTGSRTFDAASFLKTQGADTTLVQQLMKEDISQYVKRAKLVESASVYRGSVAIAKGDPAETYGRVLIAQAADTLLTLKDVVASFVISHVDEERVNVSARSLGDVNVQVIMEKLDGGGHLTNAATQLDGYSIEEVEELLNEKIDEYFEGGQSS